MCSAIDTTLGAISSGTVHSRVGACEPHSVFAKRILKAIRTALLPLLR